MAGLHAICSFRSCNGRSVHGIAAVHCSIVQAGQHLSTIQRHAEASCNSLMHDRVIRSGRSGLPHMLQVTSSQSQTRMRQRGAMHTCQHMHGVTGHNVVRQVLAAQWGWAELMNGWLRSSD